jgi:uncharacterized RDD family membrane protein YckC
MSRWRDVKKSKVEKKSIKETKIQEENTPLCNATLTNRAKAFITDSFMVMMPLMYLVSYLVIGSLEEFAQNKLLGWVYILIPHFIITVSFWYFKAQTPGLKAYELSVIDVYSGEKASLYSLINRYIFTTLGMILILPMLVPYFNKKKKTIQDILSGTCVKITPNEEL